jgi:hypothetical protein
MRFCSKCGIKHEGPTGKRRCRRAQMVELEPVEVVVTRAFLVYKV